MDDSEDSATGVADTPRSKPLPPRTVSLSLERENGDGPLGFFLNGNVSDLADAISVMLTQEDIEILITRFLPTGTSFSEPINIPSDTEPGDYILQAVATTSCDDAAPCETTTQLPVTVTSRGVEVFDSVVPFGSPSAAALSGPLVLGISGVGALLALGGILAYLRSRSESVADL